MVNSRNILNDILKDAKKSIPETIHDYFRYPSLLAETPLYPNGIQTAFAGFFGLTEGMLYGIPAGLLLKNGFVFLGAVLGVPAIRYSQALYSKKKLELEDPRLYNEIYSL